MRRVVAILLLLAGSAVAQTPLIEDPAGDLALVTAAADVPFDARWKAADLVGLAANDLGDYVRVTLAVESLDAETGATVALGDQILYTAETSIGSTEYWITFVRNGDLAGQPTYRADIGRMESGDFFPRDRQQLDLVVDAAAGTMAVDVPKAFLIDSEGTPVRPGDSLGPWRAESAALWADLAFAYPNAFGAGVRHQDFMPDSGAAGFLEIEGQLGTGHAGLLAIKPFRASNGEATTFLYEVEARSTADYEDTFEFTASNVPQGWLITFPDQAIRIASGETVSVPVLATIPFNHEHGAAYAFNLTMQSRSDPLSAATTELGVRYSLVPFPAGHHGTVYMHVNGSRPYFNTLLDDPADDRAAFQMSAASAGGGTVEHRVTVPLVPAMGIGVDADMDAVGQGSLTVSMPGAFSGSLEGEVHFSKSISPFERDHVGVATIPPTAALPLDGGALFEFDILPDPAAADGYPVPVGYDLVLDLRMIVERPTAIFDTLVLAPSIEPGGVLTLPLEEFHDDVDEFFTALSGIELVAVTPQQRLVNPGETVLFSFDAVNVGEDAGRFDLRLEGGRTDAARLLGDTTIGLAGNENRTLAVAVHAPATGRDGEFIDVTLVATKTDDPTVRSLIRLLAEIDTDADHPDDVQKALAVDDSLREQESPFLGPLLAAGLLLLARRRL